MRPTGPIPIRLILEGQNETVLTGSIRIFPGGSAVVDASGNIPKDVTGNVTTTSDEEEPYDYHGAMMFTVLVIAVYAISIVLLIASFIKKKRVLVSVEETKNVNQYLIQVSDLKEKTARENFKKLKRSIIEAVERSDSRRQSIPAGNGQEGIRKVENKAFKQAILGAGISLYSPLIVIKEEGENADGRGTSRVVAVDVEGPRRGPGPPGGLGGPGVPGLSPRSPSPRGNSNSRFLLPPSGSVTPESPGAGNDRKTLLSSPSTSTGTPISPGTDSQRPLLEPDSPSSSFSFQPTVPPEPVWQTHDELGQGYRNASFLPSPSPRMSRPRRGFDDPGLPERQALLSDIWVPLGHASRTPSPNRRSGSSQDNAVSSV